MMTNILRMRMHGEDEHMAGDDEDI